MKKFIPIITRNETSLVEVAEILFIEQETRKVTVCTSDRRYSCYMKLDDVMKYLNEDFYRTHKSFAVNLSKIKSMREQMIIFHSGENIMLCAKAYRETRQHFSNYVLKMTMGLRQQC